MNLVHRNSLRSYGYIKQLGILIVQSVKSRLHIVLKVLKARASLFYKPQPNDNRAIPSEQNRSLINTISWILSIVPLQACTKSIFPNLYPSVIIL